VNSLDLTKKLPQLDDISLSGYEEELDWSKCNSAHAIRHALWMQGNSSTAKMQFFELTNDSMFQKIGEYLKWNWQNHEKDPAKNPKYEIEGFFTVFTID